MWNVSTFHEVHTIFILCRALSNLLFRLGNFTGPGATELRQSVYYPSSSKSTLKNMSKYLLQSNTVGIFEASRYRCIASSVSLLGSLQGYGRQGESWYSYSDNWFPLVVLSQHPILSDQTERQLPSVEIIYYLVPCEWRLETDKIQPNHSLRETCLNLKSNIEVVALVISFKRLYWNIMCSGFVINIMLCCSH